jgi:hypothetical protein
METANCGSGLTSKNQRDCNARGPSHVRRHREKVFGPAPGIPLDRNAKVRIMIFAKAWTTKHRQPGQHRGPLTRAYIEVLEALLWGFHNCGSGLCFPSYEAIAQKARCCRDTVCEAIKALEAANVLTWVNRIFREQVRERDLFGKLSSRWRIVRTSNAYMFRDPLPCAQGRGTSKSENPLGTVNQEILPLETETRTSAERSAGMGQGLLRALHSLGQTIAAKEHLPMG